MPLSNKEAIKNYRERQRELLGEDEYKRIQAQKKRDYRAKKASVTVDDDGCDDLLLKIFDKKKKLAVKKSKTISLESFKKNTWANIRKIYKKMNDEEWDCINTNWLKDADANIAFIKKIYPKENTMITYISSFASVTGVLGAQFKKAYQTYSQVSSQNRRDKDVIDNENQSTEKEKEKMVSMRVLKNLYKHPDLTDRERALIALYTRLPPRRNQLAQFLTLKKSEDGLDGEFNYLVVDSDNKPQKIIMHKYKTVKEYGKFEIPLSKTDKLNAILQKYIESADIKDGDLIFPNTKGKIQANMGKEISDTFLKASGKPITVNIIRHIFISKFLEKRRSISEKNNLANLMGHSRSVQEKYMRMDLPDDDDQIKSQFYM